MAKKIEVKFQIKAVEIINLEIYQPAEVLPPEVVFKFNVSIEHKVNPQNKLIFVVVGVNIFYNENRDILGKISVNCTYGIENFFEVVNEKKPQKYFINNNVIDLLNSISISTTRGVMASMYRGTVLHNAILPVVNPQDLQKKKTHAEQKNH